MQQVTITWSDSKYAYSWQETERKKSRTIYNTTNLKDLLCKRNFSIATKNRFEALDSEDPSMDDAWTEYGDIYCTTTAETLRQRARRWKDWLSHSTWNCIEERWELKHSIVNCCSERVGENRQQMYQIKDKKLTKRARAHKRRTLERGGPWKETRKTWKEQQTKII